jgi:hypothetical protein
VFIDPSRRLPPGDAPRPAGQLLFAHPIESAEETNVLEGTVGSADHAGHNLRFTVRLFDIASFRMRLG